MAHSPWFISNIVDIFFGFRKSCGSGYPCHYCGVVTISLNAENIHMCEEHQEEVIKIGWKAMQVKYPSAGEDARNPEFFKNWL